MAKKIKEEDPKMLNARLIGIISRIHGILGLEGVSMDDRIEAVEKYFYEKGNKK